MSKPSSGKKPGSGIPLSRRDGGKKLYACANKTCPNQSHYTPSCPNVTGKNPPPKLAVATQLPEPSPQVPKKVSTQNDDVSGTVKKVTGSAFSREGMFDRAVAAVREKDTESFLTVLPDRTKEWRNTAGEYHRDGDRPAVIYADGSQEWWWHGEHHRDGDRPATVRANGQQEWFQHGELHRDNDLPAAIYPGGTKMWSQDGEYHRDGDQPAVIYADGSQEWRWHGKYHRDNDLPAIVHANGSQEWYQYDEHHRVSGPAVIHPDGTKEWWWEGEKVKHPDLCEQACAPACTEEEKTQLALLCLHDDPAVATIAVNNPSCPEDGKNFYQLKYG